MSCLLVGVVLQISGFDVDRVQIVDAHTAHHLYHQCLRGELMQGRTIILVSHHVQLCVPGASYVVALDNGRVQYQGSREEFVSSGAINALVQSTNQDQGGDKAEAELVEAVEEKIALQAETDESDPHSESSSTVAATPKSEKKPRKLVEEEARAVGRISREIWETYIRACGNGWYWAVFSVVLVIASLSPVLENGWLR